MISVDLNCDLGESFGAYTIGMDEAVIPLITSANVACGFHAGDAVGMENTARIAAEANVAVGAHPGYPDLVGFGLVLMYLAIPVGVAIAIVRPGLFDIDRATVATATATVLAVGILGVLSVACAAVGVSLARWSPAAASRRRCSATGSTPMVTRCS